MKAMSLFSSAGVGEFYLDRIGIKVVVANEIIEKRADLYKAIYPDTTMVVGDIKDEVVFNKIYEIAKCNNVEFIIASPPCQGISIAGKNRKVEEMAKDPRNYLITYVVDMIRLVKPKYVLIENVPLLLKLRLYIEDKFLTVEDILIREFEEEYDIDYQILDSSDYGVPQIRTRAIIRLKKKGLIWELPDKKLNKVTVRDTIEDLPSIESGEKTNIRWHFGRKHSKEHILWMKHTPTGQSAFDNEVYFPKKKDGTKIKGYKSSYRRIKWDEPAPTITIRNDAISSQRNVHPGKLRADGTYSDARVLSILELMRLSSLPDNWPIPNGTPEILIRQVLGECIPPLFVEALVKGVNSNAD